MANIKNNISHNKSGSISMEKLGIKALEPDISAVAKKAQFSIDLDLDDEDPNNDADFLGQCSISINVENIEELEVYHKKTRRKELS